jgi:hypothetical protein
MMDSGRFSGARCILIAIASKKRTVLMEWRQRLFGDQRRERPEKKESRRETHQNKRGLLLGYALRG